MKGQAANMKTNWKNVNEVVCEELGESALLVELATGKRWLLNTAAVALWKIDGAKASISDFCAQLNAGTMCLLASGGVPSIKELSVGSGPRRRPSPRGNSGPG
jgi:hypothetical protein